MNWNTTAVANGSYTLSARARDAAGNQTTSTIITVTVNNVSSDSTPPTVSMTAPAAGATVSGTVALSANASDNVGVVGVQFLVNGAASGAEDTSSPYSVNWNTTAVANGSYTLSARARDAAGNQTTSASITVTVNNTATPSPDWYPPMASMRVREPFSTTYPATAITAQSAMQPGTLPASTAQLYPSTALAVGSSFPTPPRSTSRMD